MGLLTSEQHQHNGKYHFVIGVGGHVAKTNRDQARKAEVQSGAVAALQRSIRTLG